MRIGVFAPTGTRAATPGSIRRFGTTADACGFHSLWVPEHVVTFDERPLGRGAQHELGVLDPFSTLSFLAGMTSTIRLGTGVTLVSQRQPLFLAKEAATVDVLSNGRLDLGIGTGWVPEEFAALQLRRDRRGQLTERNLAIVTTLWTDEISSFTGEDYELAPCRAYPKPTQRPHPPIHIGGTSDAALLRVARWGQGWYAFGLDPDELAARVRVLFAHLRTEGRTREDVHISVCNPTMPVMLDEVRRYRDAGADQVILMAATFAEDEAVDALERWAREIVGPASAL